MYACPTVAKGKHSMSGSTHENPSNSTHQETDDNMITDTHNWNMFIHALVAAPGASAVLDDYTAQPDWVPNLHLASAVPSFALPATIDTERASRTAGTVLAAYNPAPMRHGVGEDDYYYC